MRTITIQATNDGAAINWKPPAAYYLKDDHVFTFPVHAHDTASGTWYVPSSGITGYRTIDEAADYIAWRISCVYGRDDHELMWI